MSNQAHPSKAGLLQGWKEIAAYLSRNVRTVKRWEKQRDLPIRRFPGDGRASVYALISELDDWIGGAPAAAAVAEIEEADQGDEFASSSSDVALSVPETSRLASDASHDVVPLADRGQLDVGVHAEPVAGRTPPTAIAVTPSLPDECVPDADVAATASPTTSPPLGASPLPQRAQRPARGVHRFLKPTAAVAAALLVLGGVVFVQRTPVAPKSAAVAPPALALSAQPSGSTPHASKVPGVDELYARGMFFFEQRTPGTLDVALHSFLDAVAKDPNDAPAWVALANTYNLLREYATMPSDLAFANAQAAAQRAVALDPRLAQAHASLGFIDFFWKWDAVAAEREFLAAIALDPAAHLPHHWYGSMLTHQGRYTEALRELDVARRLKPDSLAILSVRALALGLSGRRSEAIDLLQEVLNQDRTFPSAHRILAILCVMEPRDIPRFLDQRAQMSVLSHDKVEAQVFDAAERAYRSGGEEAMWRALLAAEELAHPGIAGRNFEMAGAEAALGDRDAAFADLALLVQRRDPYIVGLPVSPVMASLRNDPRFRTLMPRGLLAPAP